MDTISCHEKEHLFLYSLLSFLHDNLLFFLQSGQRVGGGMRYFLLLNTGLTFS